MPFPVFLGGGFFGKHTPSPGISSNFSIFGYVFSCLLRGHAAAVAMVATPPHAHQDPQVVLLHHRYPGDNHVTKMIRAKQEPFSATLCD